MKHWLQDSLILNEEECYSFAKILNSINGELLYRATRDGFTASAFHSKCDNKSNTLTIIKNNLNYVFGGYTSSKWSSYEIETHDKDAFIFSLRRNGVSKTEKFMVRIQEDAIQNVSNSGPVFGSGDIHICDQSNIKTGSCTNFGITYHLPDGYTFASDSTDNYLAGSLKNWLTTEIEVYKINPN